MTTIADPVLRAKQAVGAQYIESVFFRVCLERGLGGSSEQKARELAVVYGDQTRGYASLPEWSRTIIERLALNGVKA